MSAALGFDVAAAAAEILPILPAETGKEAEFHLRQKPPPQFDAWWSHARALQLTMEAHGYVYTHA